MHTSPLVTTDLEIGTHILEALRRAHVPVSGALWLYVPELEEWQLKIGTSLVDKKGPRSAFGQVWTVLKKEDLLKEAPLSRISLLSPKDPLMANLRKSSRPSSLPIRRITSSYVGKVFVDDAYIYDDLSNVA